MTVAAQPAPSGNRLERFRGMMARLDASGGAAAAIERGLYVCSPGSVGARIAGHLELRPSSTHLVVGGVGSGKTTELFDAQQRLGALTDAFALYIDVSERHDIANTKPGVLAVQVGVALAGLLDSEAPPRSVAQAATSLRLAADGHWVDPDSYEYDDDPGVHVPGLLQHPSRLTEEVQALKASLDEVLRYLQQRRPHLMVFLDGLDRMTDIGAFEQLVDQDVKALASLGVGVVVVGPLKCLYRGDRDVSQRFDHFHHQPWLDPRTDPNAKAFLEEVLHKRLISREEVDFEGATELVMKSGGVLRDMIALAQLACEEAYMDGSEVVGLRHVDLAQNAFGRKHMLGLQADEIAVLQRLYLKGTFVPTSEHDLVLLVTRRILEYAGPRYAVHPTIAPLIAQIALATAASTP